MLNESVKKRSFTIFITCMILISTIPVFYILAESLLPGQSNYPHGIPILSEGFEESWPPEGWNITIINVTNFGNNGNWSQIGMGTNPEVYPFQGTYMAMFNSNTCFHGKMARLETPTLNLKNYKKVELGFWMYHDTHDKYWDDTLVVQVSLNNGEWINISNFPRYEDNSNTWKWHQLNLSTEMINENIRIGFLGISSFGHNIYIDDITLFSPFANDFGVIALKQPSKEYIEALSNIDIIATIKNFGLCTYSNIPVTLTIIGPMNYSYKALSYVNISLSMNDVTDIIFNPAWIVPNIQGLYTIAVSTAYPKDEDLTNDIFTTEITVYRDNSLHESFDIWPPEQWELVNNNCSMWQQDNIYNQPHTSNWSAAASQFYGSKADCWLITPRLSIQKNDKLTFWYTTCNISAKNVTFEVRLSIDKSQTNTSGFSNLLLKETTSTNEWMKKTIDLNEYAGTLAFIAFRFIDNEDETEALLIDDVYGPLLWAPSCDISIKSLNQPQISGETGINIINATAKNYGTTLQSFTAVCRIYEMSCINCDLYKDLTYDLIYSSSRDIENLSSNETTFVLFDPWNVQQNGLYSVNISIPLSEDENPINNYLNQTIYITLPANEGLLVEKTIWNPEINQWVKEADAKQTSTITNRIQINNTLNNTITDIQITDIMPEEFIYTDNATLNGEKKEPIIKENLLTWNIPTLDSGSTAEIMFTSVVNGCGTINNIVNATGYLKNNNKITSFLSVDNNLIIHIIDVTPPITNLTLIGHQKMIGNNLWINNNTRIKLSTNDECTAAKTYYRICYNDTWSSWETYTNEFSLNNESINIIEYYSIDENQNKENNKQEILYVDKSTQKSIIILGTPHYINQSDNTTTTFVTRNTPIYINVSDTEILESYRINYKINNGTNWPGWLAGEWDKNILTTLKANNYTNDGFYMIDYYLEDAIGNIEKPHRMIIFSDNSPPNTTLQFKGSYSDEKETWVTPNTPLWFTAIDKGSPPAGIKDIFYTIDNGELQKYVKEFTLPVGQHILKFYSSDYLNNTENKSEQPVAVDGSPPKTIIKYDGPSYHEENNDYITSETKIILTADDQQQSGINITYYRIDNSPWIENIEPFTIPWEGTHIIEYYSIDNVGNTENTNNRTIIVNYIPPFFTVKEPQGGKLYLNGKKIIPIPSKKAIIIGNLVVTITMESNLSIIDKVIFSLDGEDKFTDTEPPFQWIMKNPPLSNHNIKITVYDKLEHFESKEINIFVI